MPYDNDATRGESRTSELDALLSLLDEKRPTSDVAPSQRNNPQNQDTDAAETPTQVPCSFAEYPWGCFIGPDTVEPSNAPCELHLAHYEHPPMPQWMEEAFGPYGDGEYEFEKKMPRWVNEDGSLKDPTFTMTSAAVHYIIEELVLPNIDLASSD